MARQGRKGVDSTLRLACRAEMGKMCRSTKLVGIAVFIEEIHLDKPPSYQSPPCGKGGAGEPLA